MNAHKQSVSTKRKTSVYIKKVLIHNSIGNIDSVYTQ